MARKNRKAEAVAGRRFEDAAVITEETPTTENQEPVTDENLTPVARLTIKSVIMAGLVAGLTTEQIAPEIQRLFPNSAAARKSKKHIAWYRSKMRTAAKIAANG